MPINVLCEECLMEFAVPEKFAGKRVKCKECGGAVAVPKPAAQEASADEAEADLDEELEPSPVKRKSAPPAKRKSGSPARKKKSADSGDGSASSFPGLNAKTFKIAGFALYLLCLLIGLISDRATGVVCGIWFGCSFAIMLGALVWGVVKLCRVSPYEALYLFVVLAAAIGFGARIRSRNRDPNALDYGEVLEKPFRLFVIGLVGLVLGFLLLVVVGVYHGPPPAGAR